MQQKLHRLKFLLQRYYYYGYYFAVWRESDRRQKQLVIRRLQSVASNSEPQDDANRQEGIAHPREIDAWHILRPVNSQKQDAHGLASVYLKKGTIY